MLDPNFEKIPSELRDREAWVCWHIGCRNCHTAFDPDIETCPECGSDTTKIPDDPKTGRYAKSNDPETWGAFETAVDYHRRGDTKTEGIGFMFDEDDPFVGVDLDACVTDGDLTGGAWDIVKRLDSYTEGSPSGTGLHIIIRGFITADRNRTSDVKGLKELEIYEDGRYFTFTGRSLDSAPDTVEQRAQELHALCEEVFPSSDDTADTRKPQAPTDLDDRELIEKAKSADDGGTFARLWDGDTSMHGDDHSRADQALVNKLAFWTGGDRSRIKQLFRQSGLCRDKWTDRPDYRKRTIDTAMDGRTDFYEPDRQSAGGAPSGDGEASSAPGIEAVNQQAESKSGNGERYLTKDGRIIYVKPKGNGEEQWSVVSDFMAEIKREITREDGTRLYQIAGYSPSAHRAFEFDIEAEDFESSQALKGAIGAAAGAEAAVRAGMTRHLAPALKMLSDDVEERRRYSRTGWSDDGFIMPGRTAEAVEVELPDSLPYETDPDPQASDGRIALDNLLRSLDPKKTAPVLTFALTGPVVRHVEAMKRHGMFIKGRTGSLKTSVAQALMCIYGPQFIRDENLLKMGEGMTRNAAMALASSAHDLPILFDNYKPSTGRGDRDFINLIHNVIEGGEKARLNRNSQLKERRDIRAWPLITGEDLPSSDPASLARVLAVEFKWNSGEDNPELTKAQDNHRHLAAIGREWINWLHTEDGQDALSDLEETFPERRKKWTAFLRKRRPDMVNILRVASNLAANTLVYDAAKRCPALRDVVAEHEDEYRDGLGAIAYRMGDYTCESLEARRLLEGIKSLRAAGRVSFARRLGTDHYEDENRIGYWDEDGYYLIMDLALEAVEDLYKRTDGLGGVTHQTLCSQLKDIDLVARTGRSRTTRTVRIGDGKRQRVLHLKKEALEEPEDADE